MIFKSAVELAKDIREKRITALELCTAVLAQKNAIEAKVNAFTSDMDTAALAQAATVDAKLQRGEKLGPLAGVPIAIKDNICTKGQLTTCSSKMLENFVAPYDATVMTRLYAADMIPIGKTNLDEFAMGSSTENSAFGPSKNPWNTDYVPGGSSGGSAAAVAAGQAPLSLGSDTGGSIRQPAAFCGLVGMKPSYGMVSRYGLVAFASSLDQIGPFSRTVEDSAQLLNVIAGHDTKDSTSADIPTYDFMAQLGKSIVGKKIGVPAEMMGEFVDPEIRKSIENAITVYKDLGAEVEMVSFDMFKYAVSTYYIIAPAEASANLARFDGVRYGYRSKNGKNLKEMYTATRGEGFGHEVQRRILLGTYVLSSGYYDAYYIKAQKVRTLITEKLNTLFEKYDVLLTPTTPTAAFKFGEHTKDPLQMYMADIATIPANMAGLPAISIQCGFTESGLPIGMQLMGKAFNDAEVLQVADAFEKATDFHRKIAAGVQL